MKYLKRVLALVTACSLLSIAVYAQNKKVALVSFHANKKIGVQSVSATVAVNELTNDPNFNLKPIVDKAYNRFVNEFAKDFPFKLLDKSEVTSKEEYKKYVSKFLQDTTKGFNQAMGIQYAIVDGFVFAFPCAPCLGKESVRDECNLSKIFNTADGVMFVFLDYEIEPRMMGVAAGVTAHITIALYDKKCDKVFRIREDGKSKGKVPAVLGVPAMKPEKIQPLCEDATNELFDDLASRLAKIIKKSSNL